MRVAVITPPQPLVSAAEARTWAPVLAGEHEDRVKALLAAAQAAIEPPNGWVGRAFGVQTLEVRFPAFHRPYVFLPAPPLRSVLSVKYLDALGVEQTLAADMYRVHGIGTSSGSIGAFGGQGWPAGACGPEGVLVRFEAGYDADDPQLAPIKQAIVLSAVNLRSLGTQDLALRSEEVEGVGTTTWTVSEAAANLVRTSVDRLLSPFQVWNA